MDDPGWMPLAIAGGAFVLAAAWAVARIAAHRRARSLPVRSAQAQAVRTVGDGETGPAVVFALESGGELTLHLPPGLPPPAVGQKGRVVYQGDRLLHFSRGWEEP